MNADAIVHRARESARWRAVAWMAATAAPWLLVAWLLAWRLDATPWSALIAVGAATIVAALAWRASRGFDDRWLARALDARRSDMEDSADLLFARAASTNALQRLQRERLRQRLEHKPVPDLRTPWHARTFLANAAVAVACIAAIALWPSHPGIEPGHVPAGTARLATAARPARLIGQRIDIQPPAYTGLPARSVGTLEAKVAEGSILRWTLRFAPMPERAELVFHDGKRLALHRDGDAWVASRRIDKAALYRLLLAHPLPPAQAQLHRLDVVIDRPPQLRALQPDKTLTVLTPGRRDWALAFEASDDYGLAPTAQLRITRTEGSGENITAKQQLLTLRGQGGAARKRYAHRIDLAALGLVAGDDLIVQLSVSDRHAPAPHTTRSPSFILRWPPDVGAESSGLDGLVKKVMPAYFRSQRQIIIDAEALLKEKRRLAADRYVERSDGIGVDQRLLRLRYGQFLGEESEGAPQLMPTNDAEDEKDAARGAHADNDPARQSGPDDKEKAADDAEPAAATEMHGDHDHAPGQQRQATFGEEQAVLEQFGHTHDHAEAATLLDPGTRKLLKAALDEMWQSEVHLRQGHPERALLYAYRALGFIKQVQQASRIYLARVGLQLPPIDESRRLGGDRAGLGNRADMLASATVADAVLTDAWRALAPLPAPAIANAPDLDALTRWLAAHETRNADPLALAAAIDALRRDRACAACRDRLRTLLWPMLAHPPAAAGERKPPGRAGDAYLDALGREASR